MYTRGQATDFIEKVFGKGIPSNQGLNLSVVCPICNKNSYGGRGLKKKLVIKTDNFLCHCWVCGYRSRNLVDLIKRFHPEWLPDYLKAFVGGSVISASLTKDTTETNEINDKLRLPAGFICLNGPKKTHEQRERCGSAKAYLTARGVLGITTRKYWGFGVVVGDEALENRIIMPSFDSNGELNYYSARALEENMYPKYRNPNVAREDIVFNEINIDWSEPLTIVEGPFDLVKCNDNATCLLGSNLSSDYLLFLRILQHNTPVILALDPDAKEKTLKIAEALHNYGIEVKILTIPSQYKDVGEMARNDFIKEIGNAKLFDKNYALRSRIAGLVGSE